MTDRVRGGEVKLHSRLEQELNERRTLKGRWVRGTMEREEMAGKWEVVVPEWMFWEMGDRVLNLRNEDRDEETFWKHG